MLHAQIVTQSTYIDDTIIKDLKICSQIKVELEFHKVSKHTMYEHQRDKKIEGLVVPEIFVNIYLMPL